MSTAAADLVGQLDRLVQDESALEAIREDETSRQKLLELAKALIPEIEKQDDAAQRVLYTPLELTAARIGFEINLFEKLAKSEKPISTEEIAKEVGGDAALLDRFFKFMASLGMIKEIDVSLWGPTNLTKNLSVRGVGGGVYHNAASMEPGYQAMADYFRERQYKLPNGDITDTPFSKGHGKKQSYFDFLAENPKNASEFNWWMTAQRFDGAKWLDVMPFEKLALQKAVGNDEIVFVDVGGGKGHQCEALLKAFPSLEGHVVLQDQPSVLAGAPDRSGVKKIDVDFLKSQPVKGARAYYLRNILHDWPDAESLQILSHIRDVMTASSVLLIDEMVIPSLKAHKIAMQVDLTMLSVFVSEERSEVRWKQLLAKAGLNIEKIYTYGDVLGDSVIVCTKGEISNGHRG